MQSKFLKYILGSKEMVKDWPEWKKAPIAAQKEFRKTHTDKSGKPQAS